MSAADPSGYYRVLEVSPSATGAELKAAFRRKAQEYHPDRCKRPDAQMLFQLVNTAYQVLGDPVARAHYDTATVEPSPDVRASSSSNPPEPIRCSVCEKVTAQPRYAIFFRVYSAIVVTNRQPVQGIFCRPCADAKCMEATWFTWALAWWGIPWGPAYGLSALFTNMFGGKQPADINARLLAHQAWYFSAIGKRDVAKAIAHDALDMALKAPKDASGDMGRLRAAIDAFLATYPAGEKTPKLKNVWAVARASFFQQAAAFLVIVGLGAVTLHVMTMDSTGGYRPAAASIGHTDSKPYVAEPSVPDVAPSVAPMTVSRAPAIQTAYGPLAAAPAPPPVASKPPYVRPALTPFGHAWPKTAAYLTGAPKKNLDGYSEITVDNSGNATDVFVKVVYRSGLESYPVRQFFIPAHGKFVAQKFRAGTYDVRYLDLDSGGKSRSDAFTLSEEQMMEGIQYSRYELTLYTVLGGNMEVHPIADDEF